MKVKKYACLSIQFLLTYFWLTFLMGTDSYYSVYLLIGIASCVFAYKNRNTHCAPSIFREIFSLLISLMVAFANYSLFTKISEGGGAWKIIAVFLFVVFVYAGYRTFTTLIGALESFSVAPEKSKDYKYKKIFFISFFVIAFVNLFVLFSCCYPGTLTSDSTSEITQLMTGAYSNHHPFYFTLLIKLFVSMGLRIFNNMSLAIAMYSVFQILAMAAIFSYMIVTLAQRGVSRKILFGVFLLSLLMPYNIMYSFTFWKDVIFGGATLALLVSLYRYFFLLDKTKISKVVTYSLIFLSGVVVCLFRSNGLAAFAATVIILLLLFKKSHIKLGVLMLSALLLGYILKSPVLKLLDVRQPDILESLSIPMQQIAKVVVEHKDDLLEEDKNLLSKVASLDRIAEEYNPIIHDPIKAVVRLEGDQQYLAEHKMKFAKLYVRLALKYPSSYARAWIDQTRGYWNGGYSYWKWSDEVSANDYDIYREVKVPFLKDNLSHYLEMFERLKILNPFISIGLFVWILLFVAYRSLKAKNKELLFLTVFPIMVWGTLLVATPVFSEFRYVYYIFTTTPFLVAVSLIPNRSKSNEKR